MFSHKGSPSISCNSTWYIIIILIFFIRADAEEKYGKALIKLAEGAKGKDEIGYGLIITDSGNKIYRITKLWSKLRLTDVMLLLIHCT